MRDGRGGDGGQQAAGFVSAVMAGCESMGLAKAGLHYRQTVAAGGEVFTVAL